MHAANFEETVDKIVTRAPRYSREAYYFVREALDHTQKLLGRSGKVVNVTIDAISGEYRTGQ